MARAVVAAAIARAAAGRLAAASAEILISADIWSSGT
jgi:hypothetical protein